MVRITQDMLLKVASHTKRRTNENTHQYLKRLTHLYFQEKNIEEIDNLSLCRSLAVLYLYDNQITVIKNLGFAANLTHLYLQKNKIVHLSGLKYLQRLTKLYVGHNSITVVEGLDNNVCLAELHIEHQLLPQGEKLLFDPRTLAAVSKSLSILNIAGNNIDELSDLKVLRRLNHIMVEDNKLNDWVDLSETFLDWRFLSKLNISGNLLCEDKKWRDRLIIMSKSLVMIDNKEVTEPTRLFVQNWYAKKEARSRIRKESKSKTKVDHPLYLSERNSDGYMMQNPSLSQFVVMTDDAIHTNSNNAGHKPDMHKLSNDQLPPLEQEPHRYQNYVGPDKELPPILNVTNENISTFGFDLKLQG